VTSSDDHEFRSLLDAQGFLRPAALPCPARDEAFTVFAQQPDARVDEGAWRRNAEQFFGLRLGFLVPKKYGSRHSMPPEDATRVILAPGSGEGTTLLAYGCPAEEDDWALADRIDATQGTTGLALLARRCPTVWRVVGSSKDDPWALKLAAVLATVMLGPIVPPSQTEIFGVRTARQKLGV
jgi:hypothetical protein